MDALNVQHRPHGPSPTPKAARGHLSRRHTWLSSATQLPPGQLPQPHFLPAHLDQAAAAQDVDPRSSSSGATAARHSASGDPGAGGAAPTIGDSTTAMIPSVRSTTAAMNAAIEVGSTAAVVVEPVGLVPGHGQSSMPS